jgi:hypothetical protein
VPVEIAKKARTVEEPVGEYHLTFKNLAWDGFLTLMSVTIVFWPEPVFSISRLIPINTEPLPVDCPSTHPPVREVF